MTKPLFERRHYVAIAKVIAAMPAHKESAAMEFAVMLQLDNIRFDSEHFIAAATGNPSNRQDRA